MRGERRKRVEGYVGKRTDGEARGQENFYLAREMNRKDRLRR